MCDSKQCPFCLCWDIRPFGNKFHWETFIKSCTQHLYWAPTCFSVYRSIVKSIRLQQQCHLATSGVIQVTTNPNPIKKGHYNIYNMFYNFTNHGIFFFLKIKFQIHNYIIIALYINFQVRYLWLELKNFLSTNLIFYRN